eukprot:1172473-Prorocentrum_minimum.AAC.1
MEIQGFCQGSEVGRVARLKVFESDLNALLNLTELLRDGAHPAEIVRDAVVPVCLQIVLVSHSCSVIPRAIQTLNYA